MLRGCLVCVIYNSYSIHSLISKLCIMIVHILKMCTYYFVKLFHFIFSFLMGVELRHFSHLSVCLQNFRGAKFVLSVTPKVFIPFNSNFALWLFTYWRCAPLLLCMYHKFFLIFDGCWTLTFFSIWKAYYRLHCEIWIWFHSCLFEFFILTVNILTMCTRDAGPELWFWSLVLFQRFLKGWMSWAQL